MDGMGAKTSFFLPKTPDFHQWFPHEQVNLLFYKRLLKRVTSKSIIMTFSSLNSILQKDSLRKVLDKLSFSVAATACLHGSKRELRSRNWELALEFSLA
jgi:hypothetical protein